jgi:eukaryotic-like serine/threonine-protein kinase
VLKTGVILADRYRLDEPIAAGGVGQVWRATDQVLQRQVAVKLLRPEYADHPETLSRFRAEARHAGSLAHPAIAQVYDYGDNPYEGPPYLVMELVDGPSLADVLATEPVTPAYALDVLAKAATGLAAAHEAGVVHRDIKPGNILLGSDGGVKITDFGIAYAVGSAPVTDPGLVMGTTQYLAPERIAGGSGTPAADLYSLGIVMHECLTGVPPYEGTPAEVMAGHLYAPLPPLPAGTPYEVADLVARLTAKDPEQRLSDAGELAALARTVRSAITSDGQASWQRQALAISPVGGVAAPGGVAGAGGVPDAVRFPEAAAGFRDAAGLPAAVGTDLVRTPADDDFVGNIPVAAPPWETGTSGGHGRPGPGPGPGSALALRTPVAAHGTVALRDPRTALDVSADRGASAGRGARTVYGSLVDTGPFAADDDHVRPRLAGLRQAGQLMAPERPRGRRRAAIGIGALVLVGGAGLTGAVASGVLHASPMANRTPLRPSLSAVQPNASAHTSPRAAAPGKGATPAKHAKPYTPKHARTSAPATTAPGTTAPTPVPSTAPTSSTGTGSGSGSSAPHTRPSPSHSTPVCILGILCS